MHDTGFTHPDLRSQRSVNEHAKFAVRDLLNILHVYGYLDQRHTTIGTRLAASHRGQQAVAAR